MRSLDSEMCGSNGQGGEGAMEWVGDDVGGRVGGVVGKMEVEKGRGGEWLGKD